jgi:hypothetical protein
MLVSRSLSPLSILTIMARIVKHKISMLIWIINSTVAESSATTQAGIIRFKVAYQMIQKAKATGSPAALDD